MSTQKGRPADPVRQFFVKVDGTKAKCINCDVLISNKIERLRSHQHRCSAKKRVIVHDDTDNQHTDVDVQPPAAKRQVIQPQISCFAVKTDNKMTDQLDEQCARVFYSCNIPFNVAEQKEFKKWITMLRPGYKPTNRKELSNSLLDKVYNSINEQVAVELAGQEVTLVQDGWSDIHNNPVIASCVHTGNKSYFVNAESTGAAKKTATYCAELAEKARAEAESRFGCRVRGVVTDNEKKMEVMRQELEKADENLITYGCASHVLNLLGQDITTQKIISQIVEVNKYFRNHHQPGALLAEFGKQGAVKPQLPGATRWNSQLDCVETFIKNRPFYIIIISQHDDVIERRIQNIINNVGLFREVKNMQEQLQPIAKALDQLQGDHVTIADSCNTWINLLDEESLQPFVTKVQHRFNQAMTPHHYLAHLLHPKYKGQNLHPEHIEIAQQLLISKNSDMMVDLCNFKSEALPFLPSMFHISCIGKVEPTKWWCCVKSNCKGVSDDICNLAIQLLRFPASSASIERVFSNLGNIQSKLRNRLGLDKAAKLVMCYRELRGCFELDW